MNNLQTGLFFLILSSVTIRTLFFRAIAHRISPASTAWAIGSGTVVLTILLLPVACWLGLVDISSHLDFEGVAAGLIKGMLLTALLVAQQRLIAKSLSATTYVFPVAIGLIGLTETFIFSQPLSAGGILSIGTLAIAGVAFAFFGHIRTLNRSGKLMFLVMVAAVVGFAFCDRIGIPSGGWFLYLMYTGFGNMISALCLSRRLPAIEWKPWIYVAAGWSIPELIFNYAISSSLPVSYGYLAICLRVPLLMLIALLVFKEGSAKGQIFFGLVSLLASAPVFF